MKITINNDTTTIAQASGEMILSLRGALSFTDKSKQYQIKRLSKTVWGRSSHQYSVLKATQNTCLLIENADGSVSFPSACVSSYHDILCDVPVEDLRVETGKKLSLPWKNRPHPLRDYQEEALPLIQNSWRGLLNFATGLGKTLTAVYAIRAIGRNTLIVCPSKAIAEQFHGILSEAFGRERVGFFGDGRHKICDLTVGIAASVNNHLDLFQKANLGLIIFDETHHIAADTFYRIADALGKTGRIYGLTATDFRNDGKDLLITAGCGPTILRRDAKWGIDQGWLAQPYFLVREVPTEGRDYRDDKLKCYRAHVLKNDAMKTQIESDAQKFMAAGKRVLILVDEIEHGVELCKHLDIPFAQGEDKQSQEYIDQFNSKKVMGLIGTEGKISEGVDTRPVDVLILANFAASKGTVLQAVGRGLRKCEGKESVIVLDYIVGGSEMMKRHSLKRIEFYKELTNNVKVIRC